MSLGLNFKNFKVGDWVRVKDIFKNSSFDDMNKKEREDFLNRINDYGLFQLNQSDFLLKRVNLFNVIELWKPIKDEWCWFYDNVGYTPILSKYVETLDEQYLTRVSNGKGSANLIGFKYCEPFTGL